MINKTFRLFISSTFDDFKEERELLNEDVFLKVDRYCQAKGYNFQLIDLRWGVSSEAALMQNTLTICLEEVRRCKELSPKPNFLIMVGERYGWIPLPFKIGVNEFETIITACNAAEASFLQRWYALDNNEVGGAYYLKARIGEFSDDHVWSNVETSLRSILCKYATKCNLSSDFITQLNTSATEAEIIEGLLGDEKKRDSTIAFFRYGHNKRDLDQTRIEALKKRILDHLSGSENQNNVVSLKYNEEYYAHFCEVITSLLIEQIDSEILRLEMQRNSYNNDTVLNQILADCGSGYFSREEQLQEIENYVHSNSRTPLFVTGSSGSGKSTLLADYLKSVSIDVFFSFYGFSENSYSLEDSLNHIFKKMQVKYNMVGAFEVRMTNISEVVHKALYAVPPSEKALIVIDGLDMFADVQQLHENIFPAKLPANVKLILTAANEKVTSRFKQAYANELHLESIEPVLCYETFTKLLRQHNRCISDPHQERQIKGAISKGTTPIHIRLISSYCLHWKSGDVSRCLATDAQTTALQYIFSMFEKLGHNREFVLYTLGLIAAAPYGIAEEEIQQLVLRFPTVKEYFIAEDRHHYNRDKLPFVIWSRLFYDLKDCLTLTRVNGCIVVKFRHQIFDAVLRGACSQYLQEARELLAQFYMQQNNYCAGTSIPNYRKAYNLLALLRKNDDIANICRSLVDPSFVDSVVKIGRVEELINTCNYVLARNIDTDTRPLLVRLYTCLQNNRGHLLCYRDSFLSYAYDYGFCENQKPVLHAKVRHTDDRFVYFPYSSKCAISWFLEADRYAVCHGSCVYIVKKDTGSEICRIFLGLNHGEEPLTANNAIWIGNNTIAIACQYSCLLVYDVSDDVPNLMHSFSCSDSSSIRYVREREMLLYTNGRKLCAQNPITGEEYYSIPLSASISGFDVDISSDELYICTNPLCIQVYSLRHGDHKSTLRTRKKRRLIDDWARKLQGGYGVLKLSDELWFIYAPPLLDAPALYAVFDVTEKRMTYLTLPAKRAELFSSSLLLGKRICIIFYEDILYCVDFKDSYKLSYYPAESISNVAWMVEDNKVSVLSRNGLELLSIDSFLQVEDKTCFQSGREITSHPSAALRNMRKMANVTSKALSPDYFSYSTLFQLAEYANSNVWNENNDMASIIIEANDGKIAVANEATATVAVYSVEGKHLLSSDKMHLAINDNILCMDFSPDSRWLFIWKNHSLVIIDVETGIIAMKIDLSYRPALGACFGKDSQSFLLTLCDEQKYTFRRVNNKFVADVSVPQKLVPEVDLDAYFGPYNIYPTKHQPRSYTRINANAFDPQFSPSHWFTDTHVYISDTFWVLFKKGRFCLNGDSNAVFANPYCDFESGLQTERQGDASALAMYLREKNDLLSRIYEIGSNHFVLVSRILNAVILFDVQKLTIVAIHKVSGNILGFRRIAKNVIKVFTDAAPNPILLEVNT